MRFVEYNDRVKRYFWFSKDEKKGFLISVLVFGFLFSFNNWGVEVFDVFYGLLYFVYGLIVVGLSVFVHHAVQRLYALYEGYRVEHQFWWYGVLLAAVWVFVTNGRFAVAGIPLTLYASSSVWVHQVSAYRLGLARYGPNIQTWSWIALWGPVGNIILAGIAKVLYKFVALGVFEDVFVFNVVFAVLNLLPFPPLDGSRVFYANRLTYVFIFSSVVSYVLLSLFADIFSLGLSFLIGVACWGVFYFVYER
jgi:Zn-dependent protease